MSEHRRRRLKSLKVTRVDLVPAGANPGAHVTLAKADRFAATNGKVTAAQARMYLSMRGIDADPAAVAAEVNNPGSSKDPKVQAAAKQMLASRLPVTSKKGTTPMPNLDALADLSDEDVAAIGTYVTDLEAQAQAAADLQAKLDAATEALAKAEAEKGGDGEDDGDEDVFKSLDPAVRARIEKAEQDAAAAQAKADALEKAEQERVFKARASAMPNLTGGDDGATKLGGILRKAAGALSQADYDELERTLLAADAQLDKAADLFKSVGHDGQTDGDSVVARIAKAADDLIKSGVDPVEAHRQARQQHAADAAEYLSNVAAGDR
jgi:hypothetical protein